MQQNADNQTIKQCYLQIRGLCLSVLKKIFFTPNSLAEKKLIDPIKLKDLKMLKLVLCHQTKFTVKTVPIFCLMFITATIHLTNFAKFCFHLESL